MTRPTEALERTRQIIENHSSDQLRRDDVWQIIEHVTALEEAVREDAEFVHVIRHGDTEMEVALTFNRCDHEDCIARRELIGQEEP